MSKFELNRLLSFGDDDLVAEMRRVAALVEGHALTQNIFDKYAKVASTTVRRRFGGWKSALEKADLSDRYSGTSVSRKMIIQAARTYSDKDLIAELRSVSNKLNTLTFTMETFNKNSEINAETIRRRFGSWWAALKQAGLIISKSGKRYSDDDYFENLLTVWTHWGRQPMCREMDQPPSRISSGAYESKWGTWFKALLAFLDRVNGDERWLRLFGQKFRLHKWSLAVHAYTALDSAGRFSK